ncbi:hypothetical protein AB0O76_34570 [Streptomyces sp. NPDC086554]|uniref:hypothetical protein n=1 Tax=Streptomyces sp. NPDC086554 TaxID=3154864 RepID=UPI00342D3D26
MRPLLAERGCAIAPDIRPRTLAEVIDHLGTAEQTGIIDGTEIRVGRPAAGRKDREDPVLQPVRARQLRGHHPRP